jgi:enoyl-CoA hydratase/carnithine racemase
VSAPSRQTTSGTVPGADPELAEALRAGAVGLELRADRAVLTLSRPEVRNAQTPATWEALRLVGETLRAPEHDAVRAVVVRGEGPSFSAGLDRRLFAPEGFDGQPGLPSLAALDPEVADARIADYQSGFAWLREPRWVTVAAVAGHALGAGFQLALACDLRVVAPDVSFGMLETTLGIVPDLGGTLPLVQAVGRSRAVEMCLSGRRVGADEAVAVGLAHAVVDGAELDDAAHALLDRLLVGPAGAVR